MEVDRLQKPTSTLLAPAAVKGARKSMAHVVPLDLVNIAEHSTSLLTRPRWLEACYWEY
jgi:hypothetical protein